MSTSQSVRELAFQHVTLKNVLSHELVQSNCRHEMIEKVTFSNRMPALRKSDSYDCDACDRSDEWLALVRQLHNLLQ